MQGFTTDDCDTGFSRREFLGQTVCAACAAGLLDRSAAGQQDVAGDAALPGPKIEGVARHEAMYAEPLADKKVRCVLCPRRCEVANVERGYCGVRENQDGRYQTLVYGALCSANVDPIEKKPLFHYLPGTTAFSVATAGCNIECKFCQNWRISQFRPEQVPSTKVSPAQLVKVCRRQRSPTIAYTYSEPVVFYEYMYDSAQLARQAGVGSVAITNGYILPEPLRALCKVLTGIKVDLKAFTEKFYAETCSGHLAPVLTSLEEIRAAGLWLELVVLLVPTLNDSAEEIRQMSKWVVRQLGPDVPMHFTRFHSMYRITNLPSTPVATLERARKIAMECGVHYAYCGNVRGHPGENTYCPSCGEVLIQRMGYHILANRLQDGRCGKCQAPIPGVWSQDQALGRTPAPTSQATG